MQQALLTSLVELGEELDLLVKNLVLLLQGFILLEEIGGLLVHGWSGGGDVGVDGHVDGGDGGG